MIIKITTDNNEFTVADFFGEDEAIKCFPNATKIEKVQDEEPDYTSFMDYVKYNIEILTEEADFEDSKELKAYLHKHVSESLEIKFENMDDFNSLIPDIMIIETPVDDMLSYMIIGQDDDRIRVGDYLET